VIQLVKSKVQASGLRCRIGVKIRSNPDNLQRLQRIAVMMSVPPDIRGESAKLSWKGGVWDAMKRVVAWRIEALEPGDLIEFQAQFDCLTSMSSDRPPPKFPILVRCDAEDDYFSGISFESEEQARLQIQVSKSFHILHRKV